MIPIGNHDDHRRLGIIYNSGLFFHNIVIAMTITAMIEPSMIISTILNLLILWAGSSKNSKGGSDKSTLTTIMIAGIVSDNGPKKSTRCCILSNFSRSYNCRGEDE